MAALPERKRDTLVVIGTAPGAPQRLRDFDAARKGAFDVAAVNAGALFWERKLDLWVSYHYEHMVKLIFARWMMKLPTEDITYVFDVPVNGLDAVIMTCPFNGSSGMLATWVGLQMRYPEIVLVGVEMNEDRQQLYRPPVLGSPSPTEQMYGHFRPAWEDFAKTPEARRVKSVAGWTADLLGRP